MSISRIGRPGLVGVTALTADASSTAWSGAESLTGTTVQERQAQRADQHYAIAQYQASQEFARQQQALYPDGNFPDVRAYAQELPPAPQPAPPSAPPPGAPPVSTPAPAPAPGPGIDKAAAGDYLIRQLRQIAELHAAGQLTNVEFAAAKARLLHLSE